MSRRNATLFSSIDRGTKINLIPWPRIINQGDIVIVLSVQRYPNLEDDFYVLSKNATGWFTDFNR